MTRVGSQRHRKKKISNSNMPSWRTKGTPVQALSIPEAEAARFLGSHNMKIAKFSSLSTGRFNPSPPQEIYLVLISVGARGGTVG